MTIETSQIKSRALADLATATFYDHVFPRQEPKKGPKRTFQASLVIQIEALYDMLDEDNGENPTFSRTFDDELPGIPWGKRSEKERKDINMRIRWIENEFPGELADWILLGDADGEPAKFTRFSMITSLKRRPEWHIDVIFGPTAFTRKALEAGIRLNFRHYRGAGDRSYSIRSIKWTEI